MKRACAFLLLVILGLALNSCAVKSYPRDVTLSEKMDTNMAFAVDTAGARLMAGIYTGPGYDLDRQRVKLDYTYYLDPAFRDDPRLFYVAPASLPEMEVVEKLADTEDYEALLIRWESLYQPRNPAFAELYRTYPETHAAWGVYVRSKRGNRGALVISHGWTGPEVSETWKREGMAKYAALGYDSVLVQQPYHGLRAPADSEFSGEYFFSGEVSRTNEAFCQTVTDVRSVAAWLRNEGYSTVGIKGGSLGGITTLLTAAVEDGVDFAVAWVPPSSMGDMPEDSPLIPFIIEGLRSSGLDRAKVEEILFVSGPCNYAPAIPPERVLIIAGMGDNFVPPDQPARIYRSWEGSQIVWFAGGHVLNFERRMCDQREREFLLEHLR